MTNNNLMVNGKKEYLLHSKAHKVYIVTSNFDLAKMINDKYLVHMNWYDATNMVEMHIEMDNLDNNGFTMMLRVEEFVSLLSDSIRREY